MNLILFTVYDRKIMAHQAPFAARAEGEAIRNFQDAINNRENRQLHGHAEDFDLVRIGTFDDNNGNLNAEEHKILANGANLKNL